MSTRTLYDAVTSSNIPAGASLVAGYADGLYANVSQMRARFPHATVVTIAVSHLTRAQVADVETGDMTPAQALFWATVTMHDVPNGELTLYANTSTWPSIKAAFHAAHVALPQWWAAHYTGVPHMEPGSVATQYADPGPYDLSQVAEFWPGVDPKPVPPKPQPKPVPVKPHVSLAHVIAAAETDPHAPQGHTTHPADVRIVEAALHAGGYLAEAYATDGSYGSMTIAAYSAWQKAYSKAHHLGWTGTAVNGIPGHTSLTALGAEHGFTVGA